MVAKVVSDKDTGFKAFFVGLKAWKNKSVSVGVIGAAASAPRAGGITNVDLALIHEFGVDAKGIPPRSFLSSTADKNKAKYTKTLGKAVAKFVKNPNRVSVDAELRKVGEQFRTDVILAVKAGIPPALSESYSAQKTADGWPETPLIKTGQLIGSIEVKVK